MDKRYALTIPFSERHPLIQWAHNRGTLLKDVCAEIGISRPTLSYWDRGKCRPRADMQQKIKEYTNGEVTPNVLHDHWLTKQEKAA